jgi:hypothetical protein
MITASPVAKSALPSVLESGNADMENRFAQAIVESLQNTPLGKKPCVTLPVRKLDQFFDKDFVPMIYKLDSTNKEAAFFALSSVGQDISRVYRNEIGKNLRKLFSKQVAG